MSENVLLRAENICKSFSGVKVLKGVNLEIRAGEVQEMRQWIHYPLQGGRFTSVSCMLVA